MSLTQQQMRDLRTDLGDVAHAFDDDELSRNWDRLSNAPDEDTRFEAVKGLCFEQLLNSASKMHDYSAGAVDEKLSQIVANLEKRLAYYLPALQAARGEVQQVVVGKLGSRIDPNRYVPPENWPVGRLVRKRWW